MGLLRRATSAGVVGAALILLGVKALHAPDPGSQIGVFPLLTIGSALCATALGVAGVALMRFRRSRKLPRAIVVKL
jgi:hypothetical protein